MRDALIGRRLSALPVGVGELKNDVGSSRAVGEAAVERIAELSAKIASVEEDIHRIAGGIREFGASVDRMAACSAEDTERIISILRVLADQETDNRRRLWELRATDEYELAFTLENPLVSIVIPTCDNLDLLMSRSLPSALGQAYENIEVVIVGDNAPPETERAVACVKDDRISYFNLNRRGPYPKDPMQLWRVAGVPPWNEGVRRASGQWITLLADDDSLRIKSTEALLTHAKAHRYEVCYGKTVTHTPDGQEYVSGVFPPAAGQFGVQASIYHAGLGFMEMELFAHLFDFAGDMSLVVRMLRAGARFGMVDEVMADYYPSVHWRPRPEYEFAKDVEHLHIPQVVLDAF